MFGWLYPKDRLSEADVQRGLRMLLVEGACGQVMLVLTTGAFLIAFALLLGASNKVIGLLAAIGPVSQVFQVPAIYLVERSRLRKMLTVNAVLLSRVMWLFIAVLPFVVPRGYRIPTFLGLLILHFSLGAVGGCAFNSWIRDVVPERIMGSFFARRMAIATAVGAVLSLVGAVGIDAFKHYFENEMNAYSILFIVGALFGLGGAGFIARMPEPRMPAVGTADIRRTLAQPLKDTNFRQLIIFLGWWSFAVNLAAPFFAVYLIKEVGLTMTWMLGLGVLSQLMNVMFFKVWGSLADRLSNKSVLAVTGTMFFFTFVLWPFVLLPERYVLTLPILMVIHLLAGISTAGVALCASNLTLKAAPYGKATAYLAINGLICGLAATVAPILGGFAADWFASQQMTITLTWASTTHEFPTMNVPTLDLKGLDFLFLLAFVVGLYAMHRLLTVREEGEVEEAVVKQALLMEMRRMVRQVSTVAGVRQLTYFPYAMARYFAKARFEYRGNR